MKEIKIGTQTWMSENLNVDCFSNGDPIPEAKTKDEWEAAGSNKQPACCLYKNSQFLGKLYNYYALSDIRRDVDDEIYSILFDGCTDSASVHVADKKNGMFVRCLKKL